jgi:HD-GYP domain-containing protein (c-di-GMP phosphodiesterase class II)
LDDRALEELELAAGLHDIGKLAIPDAMLLKPGPLDDDEWAFVKRHTIIGQRIVAASPALNHVGQIIRSTHERWDGAGYPDRIAGGEVLLPARIIAVCNAFSAMTTDRPYRKAITADAAVAEIARCAGTQFDPAIVQAFVQTHAHRVVATNVV